MSMTEFVGIINQNSLIKDLNPQKKFFEAALGNAMDSICVTQSLFEGTVVDFNLELRSGGTIYANGDFSIS
ncbi:MAG: hypothetical protein HXS53_00185 [Theionarchaea archaeon]|nr:hypothetical protein [Theionarchaea archaeon]